MHEYGITESVVTAVTERMPGVPIACVRLEISEVPARCRCGSCGKEFEPDGPIPLCPCGSADAAVLSGGGMRIVSVEVASATA